MNRSFKKAKPKQTGVFATLVTLIKLVLVGLLSTGVLTQPVHAATVHWLTLVSLTFDDGRNQSAARDILAGHGMQGTFYVNSDRVGNGGSYLSKAELDGLYADGNEIGGHDISHVDLATLSDAAQKTAICNDMQNLVNWGYPIHSMAYPYGSTGPTTQSIVAAGCVGVGTYESARAVGGLVTGTGCAGCPWADTITQANPYYISTNNSVVSTTTLADMQKYVTQAEAHGGGWVPLVFHNICDNCGTLAVSPALLDTFLAWLETRTSQSTYVRTVHQVMSGDYPAPPPPPALGLNQLLNASLETDSDGNNQADCWQRSGYGTNTVAWTRTGDAHTGNFAEKVQITSYNTGDRKLLPKLDAGQMAGGCAPTLAAGEIYQFSAWYKSTAQATVALYYLGADDVWQYWIDGPQLQASGSWAKMTYYVNGMPMGAKAISFGIALNRIGTLTTDDYSVAQVVDSPPPADVIPPIISAFAPADGATVSGAVSLAASATDDVAMHHVDFLVNGALLATDASSPYAFSWNSRSVANGSVTYSVRAVDFAGNETTSNATFTVNNDLTSPTVSFDQPPTPTNGVTVSGQVPVAATASDNVGVVRVDFLVNGVVVGSDTVAPFAATWGSSLNPDGAASLTAIAYDGAGNKATTAAVNVTVRNNAGNLLNNSSLEIDANNDNLADCWQRSGFGTNAYIWTRLSGAALAHTGNFAESLQVTSRTNGDRKLLQRQDLSTCAPIVTPGTRYTLRNVHKIT